MVLIDPTKLHSSTSTKAMIIGIRWDWHIQAIKPQRKWKKVGQCPSVPSKWRSLSTIVSTAVISTAIPIANSIQPPTAISMPTGSSSIPTQSPYLDPSSAPLKTPIPLCKTLHLEFSQKTPLRIKPFHLSKGTLLLIIILLWCFLMISILRLPTTFPKKMKKIA